MKPRPTKTINPRLVRGEIEVVVTKVIVHNVCATLPFPLEDDLADKVNEDLRLTYRYLDLRRPRMAALRWGLTGYAPFWVDARAFGTWWLFQKLSAGRI